MNTPEQAIDAQKDLLHRIFDLIDENGFWQSHERCLQLIADSEARAVSRQVEALAILTLRWDKVEKERDQLRARAERAEARLDELPHNTQSKAELVDEVLRLRADLLQYRHVVEKKELEFYTVNQACKVAEAELAKERARLDWILNWNAYGHPFKSVADIDAAMKESK